MKKEETKNVNKDFDKSFVVINNLIDKGFKECKSYNDSIENLKTIEKIFKKLNYIPNPDITIKLIDENLLLSETIKIIVNNDLDIITKGEINKIFDNDTIILIIASIVVYVSAISKREIQRKEGILFLVCYFAFFLYVFMR